MKKIISKIEIIRRASPQILSVVLALSIAFLIMFSTGIGLFEIFNSAVEVLTTEGSINLILEVMVPYLLCGAAFLIGIKAGLFNIGLQGQFLMGMLGASLIGAYVNFPPYLHGIITLLAGALFGFLWILPASILKVRKGANELVLTLMLTFIASYLVLYVIKLPQIINPAMVEPCTLPILSTARFPNLIPGVAFNLLHLLVLALPVLSYLLLEKTRVGLWIKAIGKDPTIARNVGINVDKLTYLVLGLNGAICGLAGAIYLLTFKNWIYWEEIKIETLLAGDAWTGIGVCFVGGLHPFGMFFSALFFAFIRDVLLTMSFTTPMTIEFGQFLQGVVIFIVAAPALITFMLGSKSKISKEVKLD